MQLTSAACWPSGRAAAAPLSSACQLSMPLVLHASSRLPAQHRCVGSPPIGKLISRCTSCRWSSSSRRL